MKYILPVIGLALCSPAMAQDKAPMIKVDQAKVDAVYNDMFKDAKGEWARRVVQDETQKLCSQYRNELPDALFQKVLAREKASVKYPKDGKVMGDWRRGEKIAQSGFGGRFNDKPNVVNGGNCYACHQITKKELSYGTLGPSLLNYGKVREFSAKEAKAAFAKIYNPQSVMPCSNMPRFGYHGFMSEQQIKDLVALLFDKNSPANQ
ncbi:MAG: sulfur oxidation c-type cytochrome SoxX [Beijerinckiaceae bacterium]|jgi:L-cysteine S-thiosulfotransferase|nr:sulfur oxidation c-type cytochrome SoxX [Beijerinckiaceae bacterium]